MEKAHLAPEVVPFHGLEYDHSVSQPGLEHYHSASQPGLEYDHSAHPNPFAKSNHEAGSQPWSTPDTASQKPRICGLAPKIFWTVILIVVVIIAAGIGGGVGKGLAARRKSTSIGTIAQSQTSSFTSTSSTAKSSPSSTSSTSSPVFSSGCNSTDRTLYTPTNVAAGGKTYTINGTALTYKIYCYTNYADQSSGNNLNVAKLQETIGVQSLQDCISACASYNAALETVSTPSFGQLCSGVVCWPKNGQQHCELNSNMVDGNLTDVLFSGKEIDSAVLQWTSQ